MVAADSGFEDLFSVNSMAKLPWKCLSDTNLREFGEISRSTGFVCGCDGSRELKAPE